MDRTTRIKDWINENAPMLRILYENKYVGMAYDHFASLPPKTQKQALFGGVGLVFAIILVVLLSSYVALWGNAARISETERMVTLLRQFQKKQAEQSSEIAGLDSRNLSRPDQFKLYLVQQGQAATIAARMINVDERPESGGGEGVRMKEAIVKLERVNLTQLNAFLKRIEFGEYQLSISSIKVENDDQLRGYMNVDLTVVTYLFNSAGNG